MTFRAVLDSGNREHRIIWERIQWVGSEKSGSEGRPNLYLLFSHGGQLFRSKIDDARATRRGWLVGDYFDLLEISPYIHSTPLQASE
jgi:hypothetical protein